MVIEELASAPAPIRGCELLEGLPYRMFFDSAGHDSRRARFSFLVADPVAVVLGRGSATEYLDTQAGTARPIAGDALTVVQALLAPHVSAAISGIPPFQGGAAGYLAYDWGRSLERLPVPRCTDIPLPDVVLGIYDWVLAWDHVIGKAWLISTGLPEANPDARARRAARRAAAVRERLHSTRAPAPSGTGARVPETPRHRTTPSYVVDAGWWGARLDVTSSFTRGGYLDAVSRVREYILAGDIFQANLSQRLETPLRVTPWELYRRLRSSNAAPFSAFLELPEAAVLSASPERFLCVAPDGHVETRPVKGTRPRGGDAEEDAALARALVASDKDRAENLMIADLMRNDLSKVCAPGTVHAPELCVLERHTTVQHLVSTVAGQLEAGTDALDLLRAAFPGGSVTGAPKLRAMEIINEIEPCHRGIYCGSIGYWSLTGALDTSIVIRTAIAVDDTVYFSVGGAVVADSVPEDEYRETLDKARGTIDALLADG